jgi:hypothetical protein
MNRFQKEKNAIIFLAKLRRRGNYIRPRPCRPAANLDFLRPLSLVAGIRVSITNWGTDLAQMLSSCSVSMLKPISDDERSPNVDGNFASPQLWSQAV